MHSFITSILISLVFDTLVRVKKELPFIDYFCHWPETIPIQDDHYSWKLLETTPTKGKKSWKTPENQFFELKLTLDSSTTQRIGTQLLSYSPKGHFPEF